MTSAWPLRQVLSAILKADDDLKTTLGVSASKLHAVFRLAAPTGAIKPYIVVGSTSEDPVKSFGGQANLGSETLHIWYEGADEEGVLEAYGHIDRLLNGTQLTVAGYAPVRGTTRIVFIVPVFDKGIQTTHGVIDYASYRFPT